MERIGWKRKKGARRSRSKKRKHRCKEIAFDAHEKRLQADLAYREQLHEASMKRMDVQAQLREKQALVDERKHAKQLEHERMKREHDAKEAAARAERDAYTQRLLKQANDFIKAPQTKYIKQNVERFEKHTKTEQEQVSG